MLPILYSLQHCPYAMRARLGIIMAQQSVLLRAIVMKNKPSEMLTASPKGTVPVLILPAGEHKVVDESLDIMLWALQQNDPEDLLHKDYADELPAMIELIHRNDKEFKPQLEIYKKAKRFHLSNEIEERKRCEVFIAELEQRLTLNNGAFIGHKAGLIDYALLPFVRQFSRVNRPWFKQAPYPNLQAWLENHLQSRVYAKAMIKYSLWLDSNEEHLMDIL